MKKVQIKFRRLVCASLFIACTIQAQGQATVPFITTWEVADDGNPATRDDLEIIIPTASTSTYNYTVDWGDGTTTDNNRGDAKHVYSAAGTYRVSITGTFPRILFYNVYDFHIDETDNSWRIKIINQWGNNPWESMDGAFSNCPNLTIADTAGIPDLTMVTDTFATFASTGNSRFNGDVSSWDVSNVTSMFFMFTGDIFFNSDLSSWDVSKVTNMASMFTRGATFTSDLSSWNTFKVVKMDGIFDGATSFTSDLSSWNVSNVTNMWDTFEGATSFNSDLSSWDVSKVIIMSSMFSGATSFNSDLSNWNVSQVTDMTAMLSNAASFSAENYDALLTGWASLPSLQPNVIFGAPPTTYCSGEAGRNILINTYNWDIQGDNGLDCTAVTSVDEEFLSNTKIYPNPSNGKISIESSFEIDKLELYNVLGAKLFSVSKTNVLDLTSLSQGIYILKVFSADRVFAKKVIKD